MGKGGATLKIKKYYLSIHYVAWLNPIDSIKEIRFDARKAFEGTHTGGQITINKPDLYGGEDREGGVSGIINFLFGSATQTVDSFLAARFGNIPAYRGVVSVVLQNFYVGMNYYLKPFSIVGRRITSTSSGGPVWRPEWVEPIPGQMNGVHIIRDLLTDATYGLNVSESLIGTSFDTAAQTCFNEGYGFSFTFREGKTTDQLIEIINTHINAEVYKDRITGKYEIKLLRNDYITANLFKLVPSNIKEVSSLKRTLIGELFSKVNIQFIDGTTYEEAVESVENYLVSNIQGGSVEKNIELNGIRTRELAAKIGLRELTEISTQLYVGTLSCNREAETLNLGDAFILTKEVNEYLDKDLICRVAAIDLGTATDNMITIEFTEDVFSAKEPIVPYSSGSTWEDVLSNALPVTKRLSQEIPYYVFAKLRGDAEAKAVETTNSYLAIAAKAPTPDSFAATIYTNAVRKNNMSFCPYAELVNSIDKIQTTFQITNLSNFESLKLNSIFQVDNEIMSITAYNSSTSTVTVLRGCADTIPETHLAGASCYNWLSFLGSDYTPYLLTENVAIRLTTKTLKEELTYNNAGEDVLTIYGRMHLPYPPGNVKVNNSNWPLNIGAEDLIVTWASRNRFLQTINLLSYYSGNITSETNVTYQVILKRVDTSAILLDIDNLTTLITTLANLINLPGSVSSVTRVGTLATVVMSSAHGLNNGDSVNVSGFTPNDFNGTFDINVVNSTTFTYTMLTTPSNNPSVLGVIKTNLYKGAVNLTVISKNTNGSCKFPVNLNFQLL